LSWHHFEGCSGQRPSCAKELEEQGGKLALPRWTERMSRGIGLGLGHRTSSNHYRISQTTDDHQTSSQAKLEMVFRNCCEIMAGFKNNGPHTAFFFRIIARHTEPV
jgi:hypothetical protein